MYNAHLLYTYSAHTLTHKNEQMNFDEVVHGGRLKTQINSVST